MEEISQSSSSTLELERRLLDAAEALLAHQGTTFALIAFPGRLPARCVVIGELANIREMVRPEVLSS